MASYGRALVVLLLFLVIAKTESAPSISRSPSETAVVPVEILYVYGCEGSSKPRRETFDCLANGNTRLTIRGRGFASHGNEVTLEESLIPHASLRQSEQSAAGASSQTRKHKITCQGSHTSAYLPTQILYCTIPPLEVIAAQRDIDATQPKALAGKKWFDVRVVSRQGQSAIFRRAVQIKFDSATEIIDDTNDSGSDESNDEGADALKAFNNNDWMSLGIGGLEKPFRELFRRAFATRTSKAASIASAVGVQHVRGVILHGPPGTGKTLIARTVAKLLNAKNVQVINGPELMSKFVGESEKNLRGLFASSDDDYQRNGDAAALHVLIFDEIDAMLRPRGEGDDSAARAVYDGVTTQMLAYMDGIHSRSNILIIGLTNRLDALDKALLRPGRFEVQIRIPLPDDEGRKQIFAVHTKSLKSHRFLSPNINFDRLAAETSSFSGADIAGVVRSAISFALERFNNASVIESEDATVTNAGRASDDIGVEPPRTPCQAPSGSSSSSSCENDDRASPPLVPPSFLVVEEDMVKGIREILMSKGSSANVGPYLKHGVVPHAPDTISALKKISNLADLLRNSTEIRRIVTVVYGPQGSGSTTLAALATRLARFSYSQMITNDALSGLTVTEKSRRLSQAFDTAAHVSTSVIVLDKLEDLLEMSLGRRPLDKITSELMSLIQRNDFASGLSTVENAKSLIIITTSKKELAEHFGSVSYDAAIALRDLTSVGVGKLLCAYGMASTKRQAEQLASVVPSGLSLKRLMFLIHATNAKVPRNSVEGTSPLGNIANEMTWNEELENLFEGCTESDTEGESSTSHASEKSLEFIATLREFGSYSPKHKTIQEGRGLFL